MNINKVFIRETEVPIQNGTLHLIDSEDELLVEIEINVHPTVINFLNSLDYRKEQALLLSDNPNRKITGEFEIHIGKTGVLLVGVPNNIKGIEHLRAIPNESRPSQLEIVNGISIDKELRAKENSIFVNFLDAILKNEIADKWNIQFIRSLLKKIQNGERLNEFDQYLKEELNYLIEEVITRV